MLVVEGPDGAGKTTLIKTLLQHSDRQVQARAVTSEQGPVMDLVKWTEYHVGMTDQYFHTPRNRRLYDRFTLISEPIYGPLTRGRLADGFDNGEWLAIAWAHFLRANPVMLFCLPPLEDVKRNIAHLPQMAGVQENIETIYWQYHNTVAVLRGAGLRVFTYDYNTSNDIGWIIDLAKEYN